MPNNELIYNTIKQILSPDTNNLSLSLSDSFLHAKFTDNPFEECISINQVNKDNKTILILWQKGKGEDWKKGYWHKKEYDKIEIIDIDKDSIFEILISREDLNQNFQTKTTDLISLKSGQEVTLFFIDQYKHIIKDNKLKSFEVGSIISKHHKFQFKDINKDGKLDIKDKTTTKYLKSRKCSCDSDFEYKIVKKTYFFKDGVYEEGGY
jgi:hypothetical protein